MFPTRMKSMLWTIKTVGIDQEAYEYVNEEKLGKSVGQTAYYEHGCMARVACDMSHIMCACNDETY